MRTMKREGRLRETFGSQLERCLAAPSGPPPKEDGIVHKSSKPKRIKRVTRAAKVTT